MNVPSSKNHVTEQEFLLKLTPHIDQSFLLDGFEMKNLQIKVSRDNVDTSEYHCVKHVYLKRNILFNFFFDITLV